MVIIMNYLQGVIEISLWVYVFSDENIFIGVKVILLYTCKSTLASCDILIVVELTVLCQTRLQSKFTGTVYSDLF